MWPGPRRHSCCHSDTVRPGIPHSTCRYGPNPAHEWIRGPQAWAAHRSVPAARVPAARARTRHPTKTPYVASPPPCVLCVLGVCDVQCVGVCQHPAPVNSGYARGHAIHTPSIYQAFVMPVPPSGLNLFQCSFVFLSRRWGENVDDSCCCCWSPPRGGGGHVRFGSGFTWPPRQWM